MRSLISIALAACAVLFLAPAWCSRRIYPVRSTGRARSWIRS